jgi:hypothetical protein
MHSCKKAQENYTFFFLFDPKNSNLISQLIQVCKKLYSVL